MSRHANRCISARRQRGNAMAETVVALLALAPFIAGIPLLGKQIDVKQKAYDATRYAVWERTVWRSSGASNRKSEADITLEMRDRTLGNPLAGMEDVEMLRSAGITENGLWRDQQQQRLLDYERIAAPIHAAYREQTAPVDVGYWLVPAIAHGSGVLGEIQQALQLDNLNLDSRAFASATVSIGLRPELGRRADRRVSLNNATEVQHDRGQLVHAAAGAILSDSWSAPDESNLQRRIDDVTADELIEHLELPGRVIGMQALGKGKALYGEGQFGWDPDLRPRSSSLPSAYIEQR